MGGVQNFASDPLGASVNLLTFGSFGSGGYMTDAGFKQDKDDDYDGPAPQKQQGVTSTTAPSAEKVDPNAMIMAKQKDRRKHLLFQSTGRQAQGPTIENTTNKNNLF